MTKPVLTLFFILISGFEIAHSQHISNKDLSGNRKPSFTGKNLAGLQFNPLFTKDYKIAGYIISARYGYKITEPVTIGAEISGYFPKGQADSTGEFNDENFGVSIGPFARYSSPPRKRVQGFVELSPLYHISTNDSTSSAQNNKGRFQVYAAPGFTLFSRNRKFSFDLYYKISTQTFLNSRHTILAYKVNYHFN